MLAQFLNPPNWFTGASLFCSTYAMSLLIGQPEPSTATLVRACVLVVFGGVFDLLDGRVARLTRRQSEFGVQLDSIADIVGFGVAPAMIAWTWKLHELGAVGVAVAFWYLLCAAFRLARFNVAAAIPKEGPGAWPFPGHSQGLTSTMSGGALVTTVWVANGFLAEGLVDPARVSPAVFAVFVAALGYLMISSIPFRTFRDMRQSAYAKRLFAVTMSACLTSAIVLDVSMLFGMGTILYLSLGLVDGIGTAWLHRRLGQALLVGDDPLDADGEPADTE